MLQHSTQVPVKDPGDTLENLTIVVPYRRGNTIAEILNGYANAYPNISDQEFPFTVGLDDKVNVEFPHIPSDVRSRDMLYVAQFLGEQRLRGLNVPETLVLGITLPNATILGLGQRSAQGGFVLTMNRRAMTRINGRPTWLSTCIIPATRSMAYA